MSKEAKRERIFLSEKSELPYVRILLLRQTAKLAVHAVKCLTGSIFLPNHQIDLK